MLETEIITIMIAFFVLLASIVSLSIYRKLSKNGETVMTKMKLESEATIKEFKTLLYLHVYQTLVLFLFVIGGITQNHAVLDAGRALTLVYGAGMGIIFLKWWRRF